jgi:predicted ferric reductase
VPEGSKSTRIELRPLTDQPFQYFPGQFVFISVQSKHISREYHPFTLSSTPTRGQNLQVTIRNSGDWTQNVSQIEKGDRVYLQGPFGLFSHIFADPGRDIVMIAGGIGITPLLSMLRFMVDRQEPRAVTLVWSSQKRADLVYIEEINSFRTKLTGFRLVLMFTRESVKGLTTGRLNREKLKMILQGCSHNPAVFVCGPLNMMKEVEKDLKTLGLASRLILMERFGL